MNKFKAIGIRKLKDTLSAVLQEAKGGVTYLITDRDEVVVQISRPSLIDISGTEGEILGEWIRQGSVSIPKNKLEYKSPKFSLKSITSQEILDELRS